MNHASPFACSILFVLCASGDASASVSSVSPVSAQNFETRVLDAIGHPERSVEEHARAFAEGGVASLPRAFALAATGRFDFTVENGKTLELPLSPELRQALVEGAARWPRGELATFLAEVARRKSTPDEAIVGLQLLALVGDERDLPLLDSLCEPHAAPPGPSPEFREALESALGGIHERDPQARVHAARFYRDTQPAFAESVLRVLGRSRAPAALETLVETLGAHPELDVVVLTEIGRVARSLTPPVSDATLESVRSYLHDAAPTRQRAAAAALVALEDVDAIPILIDQLDDGPELARAALDALRRMSRRDLGTTSEGWSRWYASEVAHWRVTEGRAGNVNSGNRLDAVNELLALGRARLFRHAAAEYASAGVVRPEEDVARLACEILGELGSPVAEPALESALDHPNDAVRNAARAALERIHASAAPAPRPPRVRLQRR
ncbi:MAG: HEAT repeat domain-containing protein [Planctomycetes bacterium]|nr:HEAT repeat domain-containing protein [Planctomycetota bacterium]